MAKFWVLVGCVVFLSLVLLVLLVESVALTYDAWWYRGQRKRGDFLPDGFWSGRLGGLFLQERWGPLIGLGALVVESVLLGILTEVWIAVLVFVLYLVLFIGMRIAKIVMDRPIPPPAD